MTAAKKLSQEYIIEKLEELPTLPTIVYELSKIINDPMSSTSDVEKIMANDQSLTTKVLKLVNSAYYAIPGGVSSLDRAIAYAGYDTVHQLVLSASIIKALDTKHGPSTFDINEFWKHSLGVAVAAETIAKFVRYPTPQDLFTCGLVHDMGKVALFTLAPETVEEISRLAETDGISYQEAEVKLEIPNHTTIGYLLAQKWTLPSQFMACIKYHHQEDPSLRGGLASELNQVVDVIYLANLLIHALKYGDSGHSKVLGIPKEVMQRLTIDPQSGFKKLVHEIKSGLDGADGFLRILASE
jgi:putative nucleotidyltransferase with HDIG domain